MGREHTALTCLPTLEHILKLHAAVIVEVVVLETGICRHQAVLKQHPRAFVSSDSTRLLPLTAIRKQGGERVHGRRMGRGGREGGGGDETGREKPSRIDKRAGEKGEAGDRNTREDGGRSGGMT